MKSFLALLFLASSLTAQIKTLPACKPGYEYVLVKHEFICTDMATIVKLNDDRLSLLEKWTDDLVPHLRIAIALCRSGQTWAEIDNEHPEAQRIRKKLAGPEASTLKVDISLFDSLYGELRRQKLNSGQQARLLKMVEEVTPLMDQYVHESRRYLASQ